MAQSSETVSTFIGPAGTVWPAVFDFVWKHLGEEPEGQVQIFNANPSIVNFVPFLAEMQYAAGDTVRLLKRIYFEDADKIVDGRAILATSSPGGPPLLYILVGPSQHFHDLHDLAAFLAGIANACRISGTSRIIITECAPLAPALSILQFYTHCHLLGSMTTS